MHLIIKCESKAASPCDLFLPWPPTYTETPACGSFAPKNHITVSSPATQAPERSAGAARGGPGAAWQVPGGGGAGPGAAGRPRQEPLDTPHLPAGLQEGVRQGHCPQSAGGQEKVPDSLPCASVWPEISDTRTMCPVGQRVSVCVLWCCRPRR